MSARLFAAVFGVALALAGPGVAQAQVTPGSLDLGPTTTVARGVQLQTFTLNASHGDVEGDLLRIDLRTAHVGLLSSGAVASRDQISHLADAEHAVAGVNADFFNINQTNATVGPVISHGQPIKAAVPLAQRYGPALPPGTTTSDVIGVGVDGRARLGRLELAGAVTAHGVRLPLAGLNQYALREGGIGAFTQDWGSFSRERATCGSDTDREAPCSTDTAEVTVRRGVVTSVATAPGSGPIPRDTVVLVGREGGADQLRALAVGQRVQVHYGLVPQGTLPFDFAVGGYPILRGGAPLAGVDDVVSAPRTSAGVSADGRTMYLLTVDGPGELAGGLTVAELANVMSEVGAAAAMNLDGGGSSTLVARAPGDRTVTVQNDPSDSTGERAVSNGIGVFAS